MPSFATKPRVKRLFRIRADHCRPLRAAALRRSIRLRFRSLRRHCFSFHTRLLGHPVFSGDFSNDSEMQEHGEIIRKLHRPALGSFCAMLCGSHHSQTGHAAAINPQFVQPAVDRTMCHYRPQRLLVTAGRGG